MKAIIPTGGRGTRMQPLTFSTNKHFIPIANKPLIYYPIESVVEAGIKEIIITYNPGWLEKVKQELGEGKKWGIKFIYVLQEKPLGLANIVQVCEDELEGDSFLLHLGDNIFVDGITEYVKYFVKNKPNGMVTMLEHPENTRMGVPYFDKQGRLKKYVEKPKNPPHKFAVPGLYFFDKNIFKCFRGKDKLKPSNRGEYEIPDAYQWMIDRGYKILVKEYQGKWLDPGKFGDWIQTNRFILDKTIKEYEGKQKKGVEISGRVKIGQGVKIQNSVIMGPSIIGNGVKLINAYVGPYSSIGEGSEIKNSHVENSVLMNNVIVHGICQPITESVIGSGAEILDHDGPTNWLKFFVGEKSKVIL